MMALTHHTFSVGDGASYHIGGDSYPMTVRKVSSTGKTVWASRDDFVATEVTAYAEPEKKVRFIPRDVPESEWEKFTLRYVRVGSEIKEVFRPVGSRCGSLSPGRCYRQDPSF